jgi:hypothetical protein
MNIQTLLALSGIMALTSLSFAEGTGPTDTGPTATGTLHDTWTSSPPLKSETAALLWSLFGTAVPVLISTSEAFGPSSGPGDGEGAALMFLGAVIIGPSLGHFYAKNPNRAFRGIGLRSLAVVGLVGAIAANWNGESNEGIAFGIASLGLGAGVMIWDIASAPDSARDHNEEIQQRRMGLGIIPPIDGRAPGLFASVSF